MSSESRDLSSCEDLSPTFTLSRGSVVAADIQPAIFSYIVIRAGSLIPARNAVLGYTLRLRLTGDHGDPARPAFWLI